MAHSALNAKIAGMRGKLLNAAGYSNLCAARKDGEVYTFLKRHESYSHISDNGTSLSQQLYLILDKDFKKICGFINDSKLKSYLAAFYLKREITELKQLLRATYNGEGAGPANNFALHKLKITQAITQIEELISALGSRKYHEIIKNAYGKNKALIDIETALDLFYYSNLYKAQKRLLTGADREAAKLINGVEIDVQNISSIYRLKTYYHAQPDVLYKYILPINYKISTKAIIALAEAKDRSELLRLISGSYYGDWFSEKGTETFKYAAISAAFQKAVRKYSNSIALLMYYLYKKELELKNIISIFEGLNYPMTLDIVELLQDRYDAAVL